MRVCYPFVGDTIGGSHVSMLALIRALPDFVHPLVLVHREGMLTDHLRGLRVPFQLVPFPDPVPADGPIPGQAMRMAICAVPLSRFLRRHEVDIVHTNDLRMHVTWGLAARGARAAFIWHQRSPTGSRRFGVYSTLAHRVLTVSEFSKGRLAPGLRRRARVVLNPFEVAAEVPDRVAARRQLLDELDAHDDAGIVGYVGNIVEQKRPEVFVRMAAEIDAQSKRPMVFPMFGEPRDPVCEAVMHLIRALELEGRVVLMGPRFPVEPAIAGCDVLAAPAVSEGFGRTLVESMLVRTPVVASADGGHLQIIEHGRTGLLVPPDDPSALANAVQRLLDNPVLSRSIAGEAYRTAVNTYSIHRHVEEVIAVYRELKPR